MPMSCNKHNVLLYSLYFWLNSFIVISSIYEIVAVFCVHVLFRNSFSQLVGEEFLKFFDFSGDSLDVALRRFVRHLTAASEPQDYDQLLSHFAQRYHSCNSDQYKSSGTICIVCSCLPIQFCFV